MKYIKLLSVLSLVAYSLIAIDVLALSSINLSLIGNCTYAFGPKTDGIIKTFISIIAYGVPVAAIVLSTMDVLKAVTDGTGTSINSMYKKFALRMVISLLVFLTPSLLRLIFKSLNLVYCAL